jgi:hypothetical protein
LTKRLLPLPLCLCFSVPVCGTSLWSCESDCGLRKACETTPPTLSMLSQQLRTAWFGGTVLVFAGRNGMGGDDRPCGINKRESFERSFHKTQWVFFFQ